MRVEKALKFLTSGYETDIQTIVNGAIFDVQYDEMVIVKDIEFFSMCEHHMLPFFGKMHVAYLAKNKVIGLSKIPRIVDAFARRLQIQERLTQQVAQCMQDMLDPLGVGVICEASHFCMMMRGVEKQRFAARSPARCWGRSEPQRNARRVFIFGENQQLGERLRGGVRSFRVICFQLFSRYKNKKPEIAAHAAVRELSLPSAHQSGEETGVPRPTQVAGLAPGAGGIHMFV